MQHLSGQKLADRHHSQRVPDKHEDGGDERHEAVVGDEAGAACLEVGVGRYGGDGHQDQEAGQGEQVLAVGSVEEEGGHDSRHHPGQRTVSPYHLITL